MSAIPRLSFPTDSELNIKLNIESLNDWRDKARSIENEINQIILGQESVVRQILIAIFARGHVLLEGDVGVGKTTMLRAFSICIGGSYERVEGTIDLMPNDLLYNTYIDSEGSPVMRPGPVIRHDSAITTLFFNEINRARPQVHSLLLRIMAERSAQAFDNTYSFPHLLVFADRNKIEREETFELPAAARDRFFFEINVNTPDQANILDALAFDARFHDTDELLAGIKRGIVEHTAINGIAKQIQSGVEIAPEVRRYIMALCHALRHPDQALLARLDIDAKELVRAGVSPRGVSMLVKAAKVAAWLNERSVVIPEDIHAVFYSGMAHRVFLSPAFEYRREEIMPQLINAVIETAPSP